MIVFPMIRASSDVQGQTNGDAGVTSAYIEGLAARNFRRVEAFGPRLLVLIAVND